ncbi:MAG: hypothetical protein ACO20F_10180 [Robiginitalea sp.]
MKKVKSVAYGVCKTDIATDNRLLRTRVQREFFKNTSELFDPIIPDQTYIN